MQERATQTIEIAKRDNWLLDIALDHLSLGRALMGEKPLTPSPSPQRGERGIAAQHLQRAVDGLRQAGHQDDLPRGLLARAALYRTTGEFEKAQRDLEETMQIAVRGGMRLHECDAHLEYARLCIAAGDLPGFHEALRAERRSKNLAGLTAREHLEKAKALIDECGYHRRDAEAEELEKQLADS